jgi:2-haloacid dehalogenase
MRPVIAFNLNGTLLDPAALDPLFAEFFGDAAFRRSWFLQVEKLLLLSAATTVYHDFDAIAQAALGVIEAETRRLSSEEKERFNHALLQLPAFPDVEDGLKQLRDDFTLVVLTNSTLKGAMRQISNAGLTRYFAHVHSADEVQHFKPAPEPYRMLAQKLGIGIGEITLVAAHAWDIAGATWVGCQTAFIRRPGQHLSEVSPTPNLTANDLLDLAAQLQRRAEAA